MVSPGSLTPQDDATLTASPDQLRSLANAVRLRMVGLLRGQTWTMAALGDELGLGKGSVSYHLRVLERAGIVRQSESQTVRGGRQQLWTLGTASIAGDPDQTGPTERPALLRVLASQMALTTEQRLFVAQIRLTDVDRDTARVILEDALERIRALESNSGTMMTVASVAFTTGVESTAPRE